MKNASHHVRRCKDSANNSQNNHDQDISGLEKRTFRSGATRKLIHELVTCWNLRQRMLNCANEIPRRLVGEMYFIRRRYNLRVLMDLISVGLLMNNDGTLNISTPFQEQFGHTIADTATVQGWFWLFSDPIARWD
jgi:hypothetical protein